ERELALQSLLHDLEVEHAQESAAKAVAERQRRLRLEAERGVVQPELLERVAEGLVVGVLDRVEAGEHHRLGLAVAWKRYRGRAELLRDRLADAGVGDPLDRRRDEPHLPRRELIDRAHG